MIRVRSAISPKSRTVLMALALGTVFGVTSLGSGTVQAQDANMSRQVEKLREDLDLLQRYVYREGTGDAGQAAASSGGGASTPAAARQQVQISDLERATTQLTGQLEQFDFRIRKMEDRLERLVADIDFRLSQLEGGGASGAGATGAATPLAAGEAASGQGALAPATSSTGQGSAATGETLNDQGTKLFGVIENEGQPPQIPSGTSSNTAPAPQTQTAATATGTPEEQYREAFGLLRKQDFAAAEQALGNFVSSHPNDPLAGNAQYWLGETYYVRGQYENAAIAFTEGFQTYPDSTKAPDNLLKLGMSLANLGKNEDACTAFGHLLDNFPNASNVVLDRARQERQNRGCPQ
ncbi:tol-pal system protein YbgF [Thalassospira australica]|uniref:tol-pal system protein YbgF n=1 Tax=Thalassospira australica TaxID=1528106 RepID=UPI00051A5C73|nr:tol-pal system protein YbgF [Thalassospira australica]